MPEWLAIGLALVLVVVAQVKINVTNAYSGSLAWSNVYTRLTKTYPGRSIFIFFNLAIALALMWMDVFSLISFVLSLYANVVMAWLVTIAADIAINKHVLRISPRFPEFRRGMLHDWNPVGLVSVGLASLLSLRAFAGLFGAGRAAVLGADRDRRRGDRDPAHGAASRAAGTTCAAGPTASPRRSSMPTATRRASGSAAMSPATRSSGRICWPRRSAGPHGEMQYVSSLALTLDDSDRYVLPPSRRRGEAVAGDGRETDGEGRGDDGGGGRHPDRDPRQRRRALREHPFDDISYRALGDAVGVSERTVYRQFPTRSHLLEGVAGWIEATEFPLPPFVTIPQFQEASRARFRAFDASPAFAFVCARAASISPTGEPEPTFFTRALVAMLAAKHPL